MSILKNFEHHISIAQHFATKKVIQRFADDAGMVYFGSVDQHEDEHELVRGVTLSANHKDHHYCVGSVQGYDAILVQRTDQVLFPNKPPQDYSWMILQLDLRTPPDVLPHVFMDAHHHDETFYANLFVKFTRFQKVDQSIFAEHDPAFLQTFNVYSPPDAVDILYVLFTPEITRTLTQHFKHLDFEINNNQLLVYSSNVIPTRHSLEHMVRAGVWLASHIDTSVRYIATHGRQQY